MGEEKRTKIEQLYFIYHFGLVIDSFKVQVNYRKPFKVKKIRDFYHSFKGELNKAETELETRRFLWGLPNLSSLIESQLVKTVSEAIQLY